MSRAVHMWRTRDAECGLGPGTETFRSMCRRLVTIRRDGPEYGCQPTRQYDPGGTTCLDCLRTARREALLDLERATGVLAAITPQIQRLERRNARRRAVAAADT